MTVSTEPHHRITVEQFERYCDTHPDDRLELIDGAIHNVSPETEAHADTAEYVAAQLRGRYPDMRVKIVGSVRLDDGSLWEPDVYVYRPDPSRDRTIDKYPHASEVVLAVEVSVNTTSRDLGLKLHGYARNGIPEYWVIDLRPTREAIRRFRDPADGDYRTAEMTPLPDGIHSLRL